MSGSAVNVPVASNVDDKGTIAYGHIEIDDSNIPEGVVMEPRKVPLTIYLLCAISTVIIAIAIGVATYLAFTHRMGKSQTLSASSKMLVSSNVTVYHAASLNNIMKLWINPGYTSKYNIGVNTVSDTSGNLAKKLKTGVAADVFISADGKISQSLIAAILPNSTKPVVEWYTYWASTRLGIGYSMKSPFAALLGTIASKGVPWYEVLNTETMKIGRTEPDTDPKGNN